MIVDIFLSFSN